MQLEAVAKGRLLLVDDDALFRESLGQNLVDEGYEVENVDGGQAALDHLANDTSVDTVLLDWRMPGLDGLAVLRLMRERSHSMPVLFLTALTDNIYEEAALALGAVDFISKSRSLSVILQRLSLIMDGRKRPVAAGSEIIQRGKLELAPGHRPRLLGRPPHRADADRIHHPADPGGDAEARFLLSRHLRHRAGQGVRRRLGRGGLPGQRAFLHQAHPAEIPRAG